MRRGTTSEWNAANPVLASGEPGLDTTLGVLKVGDGATAWQSLAMSYASAASVTALQPTPWTPFAYAAGYSAYGGFEVPGYRRIGDVVYLRGLVNAAAGLTGVMATLPAGFRPPTSTVLTSCYSSQSPTVIRIDILTNGTINISAPTAGNWYAMSAVPPFSVMP